MVNFPTSLDTGATLPNPTTSSATNSPSHAGLHGSENAAIIAAETKIGIGSSVPAANTLLFGTGAGTTAWQGLTSAQLAAVLSDETGTGSAVFANTPVLITPKVDTINENSVGNGTTIGGVNIKSGALNTANSVPAAAIQAGAVTTAKLASGASFLPRTVEQNPYKFSVYRGTAQNTSAGVYLLVQCDTKLYDTGSNVDIVTNKGRFTAPLAGFYHFDGLVQMGAGIGAGANHVISCALYKNSVAFTLGSGGQTWNSPAGANVSDTIQLAASDFVELYVFCDFTGAMGVTASTSRFSGHLVSNT